MLLSLMAVFSSMAQTQQGHWWRITILILKELNVEVEEFHY